MAKEHLAVIEAQAGIAVDPDTGLFFIGDTGTGMYLADPGEIMFRANGQDILWVQQLGGDTYVDSLAFETYINRRAIIYSATEAPRLQLDLAAEGRAAIEFESSVAGGDGAIRYFDPTETPGLPSEMQFRVGDESIVHMLAESVEIDGDLTLDGGDLSVHKTGGPTLKLSGMAGSEQGHILFEGLEGSGAIRYTPDPRQFIIQPNAASSLGWVIIDTSSVHIGGLELLVDSYPVWHQGNLNPSAFSFTPTLVTTGDPMTISYANRDGRWARVGPLVYVAGRIEVASVSGGTGNLRIGGLPFTTANGEADRGSFGLIIGNANSWPPNTSSLLALAMAGETRLGVYAAGPTTGISSFTPANIKASTTIRFGGWYLTDDPLP